MGKFFQWKVLRWVLLVIVALLGGIQFVPVDRSNPAVETEIPAPANVGAVLKRSCYNCHSNETVWPWYSRVAPVSWFVASDVHEGREELNFSTWSRYTAKEQFDRLKDVLEEVEDGGMPPWWYLPFHREARLSDAERTLLRTWILGAPQPSGQGGM